PEHTTGRDRHYISLSERRLPNLFHRLHFGWATRGLFVLEVRPEQTIRRDSQYIRSAARRLPTLFHRLHFDWATHRPGVGLTLQRRRFQGARHLYFTDYTLAGQRTGRASA